MHFRPICSAGMSCIAPRRRDLGTGFPSLVFCRAALACFLGLEERAMGACFLCPPKSPRIFWVAGQRAQQLLWTCCVLA